MMDAIVFCVLFGGLFGVIWVVVHNFPEDQ